MGSHRYQPGDRVVLDSDDGIRGTAEFLAAGTPGTVLQQHADLFDGVDVRLDDGRVINTVVNALDPEQPRPIPSCS